MDVVIRDGRATDLEAVVRIYNHFVVNTPATFDLEPVRVEDRREWLAQHTSGGRHRLVVAEEGGEVVGWATTSPFRPRAAYATTVESSVYCAPTSQGRGLGTRLYRHLFESLRTEDIERIVAGITLPNPASLTLHERFGFRTVGTFSRVGRKFGRYWDVRWLERPGEGPAGPDRDGKVPATPMGPA
jgi:phosphinothricin acetyltransferase